LKLIENSKERSQGVSVLALSAYILLCDVDANYNNHTPRILLVSKLSTSSKKEEYFEVVNGPRI